MGTVTGTRIGFRALYGAVTNVESDMSLSRQLKSSAQDVSFSPNQLVGKRSSKSNDGTGVGRGESDKERKNRERYRDYRGYSIGYNGERLKNERMDDGRGSEVQDGGGGGGLEELCSGFAGQQREDARGLHERDYSEADADGGRRHTAGSFLTAETFFSFSLGWNRGWADPHPGQWRLGQPSILFGESLPASQTFPTPLSSSISSSGSRIAAQQYCLSFWLRNGSIHHGRREVEPAQCVFIYFYSTSTVYSGHDECDVCPCIA